MGRRLIRIAKKDIIATSSDLINRELDVVMISAQVYHGVFIEIKSNILTIRNMLGNKHHLDISIIDEIIYSV